jgi:hypothetical protein
MEALIQPVNAALGIAREGSGSRRSGRGGQPHTPDETLEAARYLADIYTVHADTPWAKLVPTPRRLAPPGPSPQTRPETPSTPSGAQCAPPMDRSRRSTTRSKTEGSPPRAGEDGPGSLRGPPLWRRSRATSGPKSSSPSPTQRSTPAESRIAISISWG